MIESFRSEKAQGAPVLVASNVHEFFNHEDESKPTSKEAAAAYASALDMMGYDFVYLAPEDKELLARARFSPPAAWREASAAVHTQVQDKSGVKVGLVFLPTLSTPEPSREVMDQVAAAARELRSKVDLVAGVSPWGLTAEEAFLSQTADSAPFDLLLGGGPGAGFKGRVEAGGQTVWVRPYTQGRGLNVVEIESLPAKGEKAAWIDGQNVKIGVATLKDDIPADPKIEALFKSLSD